MKLTFYGADRAVTGSCHCLEAAGARILVDCGLQQGGDELDGNALPFAAGSVDAVLVTHAHIDHSGRLPLLVRQGFGGRIYCTRLTGDLLQIMLRDSAHIQESDAEYATRKAERAGRPKVEPLYTLRDAETVLERLVCVEYGEEFSPAEGVRVRFADAGHLLGSACAEVWATENGKTRKLVFSGDIGNVMQPVIRDPVPITEADLVVMESTYGDREHDEESARFDRVTALAEILSRTFRRGGNVVIPSFAVGRTQELLYFFREIKARGLVPDRPHFRVCVDSPLAREATRIFAGDLRGYTDPEAEALRVGGVKMFEFDGLELVTTTDESKALNADPEPKVILSASGMCDAGRIRHHLKYNLWRPDSTVVFVGFQSPGSLGRRIQDGAEKVKLFSEEIAVRAEIVTLPGMSSHADRSGLLGWIEHFSPRPQHVFVVHGDSDVAPAFASELESRGFSAHAPKYCEEYDLDALCVVREGAEPKPKAAAQSAQSAKPAQSKKESAAYAKLIALGQRLTELIGRRRNASDGELKKFAAELEKLLRKWEK